MKKLMLALLMAPALAQAAQWIKLGAGGDAFIDKASIIKSGAGYKAWSMLTYPKEQTTPDGTAYRSVKALHVYACAERTTTLLSQVYYGEPMGKGPVLQSFKYEKFSPEDIIPDSPSDGALKVVCKGKK